MTIAQKLERKINEIYRWTGEWPEEIEITRDEYNELARSNAVINFVEVLDQNRQPLNKFMNVKLKIKE